MQLQLNLLLNECKGNSAINATGHFKRFMCYLEVLPFFATFGRGRSSGSLWGSSCRSYAWTSTLAWAPKSHIAIGNITKTIKETWRSICRLLHVWLRLFSDWSKNLTIRKFAYTEVVERGIGQPTSGDIFSQLIEHLGILHNWVKKVG